MGAPALSYGATRAAAQTFKSIQVMKTTFTTGEGSSPSRNFFFSGASADQMVCLWAYGVSGFGGFVCLTQLCKATSATTWTLEGGANGVVRVCFAELANGNAKYVDV